MNVPAAALQIEVGSRHMQSHRKDVAHPTNDQLAQVSSAADQHSVASQGRMGILKERLEDMQNLLTGKMEEDLRGTHGLADQVKDASKDWAQASKEIHSVAFKRWNDASKEALQQLKIEDHSLQQLVK